MPCKLINLPCLWYNYSVFNFYEFILGDFSNTGLFRDRFVI